MQGDRVAGVASFTDHSSLPLTCENGVQANYTTVIRYSNWIDETVAELSPEFSLDIDGNGIVSALTDGLLTIRYLAGFTGAGLITDAESESSDATGINGEQDNNNLIASGAAYMFTRDVDGWAQQAYIKASNPDIDASFGWSVAIDGNVVVVGANEGDTDSEEGAGAVYVY